MNPNVHMLIQYLVANAAMCQSGGHVVLVTPPEGINREQRRIVERQVAPFYKNLTWRTSAAGGCVDGTVA